MMFDGLGGWVDGRSVFRCADGLQVRAATHFLLQGTFVIPKTACQIEPWDLPTTLSNTAHMQVE